MVADYWSYFGIWFWSNSFIALSRFVGVTRTIRAIRWGARVMPLNGISLDDISDKVELLYRHTPFFFLARKQKCLIRGFLLFFFGKRMRLNMCIRFGCQWENNRLKTHCWILENDIVRYEVDKVIKEYETIVEYR